MSDKKAEANLDAPSPDNWTYTDIPGFTTTGSSSQLDSRSEGASVDHDDSSQPLITPKKPARTDKGAPPDRVRFILAGSAGSDSSSEDEGGDYEADMSSVGQHYVFCQMDSLCHFEDGGIGFKEMARWLKYEEKVEPGDRWSKPHVATTSLHALMEIRRAVADDKALVELDLEASHSCIHQIAERIVSKFKERGMSQDKLDKLLEVLVSPHKHQHRHADKSKLKTKAELKKEADENVEGKKKKVPTATLR